MRIDLSIILPCYNEEENIFPIYQEIKKINFNFYKIEVIFINNGSTDNTIKEINSVLKKKLRNIHFIKKSFKDNIHYGGAISEGIKIAKGKFISWTHADLQTPLNDVFRLFLKIKDEKKIFGRGIRVNNRGFDGFVSRLHEILASFILGKKMKEINAQPKMFKKSERKYFSNPPFKWTTIDTFFFYKALKKNFKIAEIKVVFKNRIFGESKWKNNYKTFLKHLFFNFLYLIKLRLTQ